MIEPHGGKLINKVMDKASARKVLSDKKLRKIRVNRDIALDLEKIAIGAYSPLTGFMCKKEIDSVVREMRLPSGEAWTIPIYFPVDDTTARGIKKNEKIVISEENGREVGLIKVKEVFTYDKKGWVRNVFGTGDRSHPGVKRLHEAHNKFIGGEIWMIRKPDFEFEKFNLTPAQTRAIIKKRGWKTVSAFQTRNAPHRAHEYLQKVALSVTDGIIIHPIIGWKKDGDFRPELVIASYNTLIEKYFPRDSVIFAGLATAMRYAGPREAVFHAIIRKNYGCTHFIVGRDHAGVGDFYEKYEAHRIFDRFPDIGVVPLLLRGPYYCEKCKETVSDKVCPHPEKWHKHISGTMVRDRLSNGKSLPEWVMRKEVADVLRKVGKGGFI